MLKTNSKAVNEKIKNMIIDCYNNSDDYYGFEGRQMATDYKGICADILNAFYNEKVKHDKRHISRQALFVEWCQGLPTAFDLATDIYYRGSAVEFIANLLEQLDTEKKHYTEAQSEELATWLFYRELTKHASKEGAAK